jgi:two-component system NarL family response regulator
VAIRVLICDDHPVVREGLAAMIQQQPDLRVVAEARDGHEAVALYAAHLPDVTLMDLRMPGLDGVAAITTIRSQHAAARILVLTTFDGDEDIFRGLAAGARGYLLKDAGRAALLEAIRAVHAGKTHVPPDVAVRLAGRWGNPQLTARELDVMRLLAQGMSNGEIGRALVIAEGTVKVHVNSILTKLGAADRTQAVTIALRRGIIRLDEESYH